MSAGAYDPPARGIIVDSTEEGERGEAFGMYSAAQMGGFLIGPVIGAAGAVLGGGFWFPFALTGGLAFLAAIYLAVALPSSSAVRPHTRAGVREAATEAPSVPRAPLRALVNRLLIAAVVMNLGFALSGGTYEVIWSLYLTSLGASIDFIGLTFALFSLPVLLLSAYAGRVVDRRGGMPFAAVGGLAIAACGLAYSVGTEPVFPAAVVLIEGMAFAFIGPALYALIASASPAGRSATAQGIFGASTQIGIAVGALGAGWLWAQDPRWPFWAFAAVSSTSVLVGVVIARGWRPVGRSAAAPATLLVVLVLAGCAAQIPTAAPTLSPATPTASVGLSPTPAASPSATATIGTAPPSPETSPSGSPSPTSQIYVVQPGDSLSSIAERFGLSVEQLLAANPHITDPDHVEVGAVLTIPSPDAPVTVPTAGQILDPTGDLFDDADQPAFAPGYIDLTALEARVDAEMLFIELLLVAAPPPADPDVEQLDYSVYVDTDADDQADYQLRASNSLDPDQDYAGAVTDLASGATSSVDDFPGDFSVEDTIRFEVLRSALGSTRRYGVAVIGVRRFFPGGVADPEVEAAIDRIPEQAWPRPNAQWLEVGL
jgi:MFS family permease